MIRPWSASRLASPSGVTSSVSRRGGGCRLGRRRAPRRAPPSSPRSRSGSSSSSPAASATRSLRRFSKIALEIVDERARAPRQSCIRCRSSVRTGRSAALKTGDFACPGASATITYRFVGSYQPGRGETCTLRAIPPETTPSARFAPRSSAAPFSAVIARRPVGEPARAAARPRTRAPRPGSRSAPAPPSRSGGAELVGHGLAGFGVLRAPRPRRSSSASCSSSTWPGSGFGLHLTAPATCSSTSSAASGGVHCFSLIASISSRTSGSGTPRSRFARAIRKRVVRRSPSAIGPPSLIRCAVDAFVSPSWRSSWP